jgi:CheY-like chemotaxis protein
MASLSLSSKDRTDASSGYRQAASNGPLVLVVEDHDDTRFMLEYLLEMRGCRVAVAADGEEAVHTAETEHPDLILMDAVLPLLDGLTAARRIRESPALRRVPIVFLSGQAHPSFRAVALATGGNDLIVKPFGLDQFERVLERHLGKRIPVKAG